MPPFSPGSCSQCLCSEMALENEHALETVYGFELAAFLFNEARL